MAKVIKVNVKEHAKNLNEIPANNEDFKKKIMNNIENKDNNPESSVTHMLLTVIVSDWGRMPEVGEKVKCKKQFIYPQGYNCICVSNAEGTTCGHIFANDTDTLHGAMLDDEKVDILPNSFVGTVVEIGHSSERLFTHLMMIAVECETPKMENVFTVVSPGKNLLAPYGSIFTAVKEKRFSGNANIFAVYDGNRKIGIISPKSRVTIPGTEALTFVESIGYPNSFKVKVVGDGLYDGINRAIKVELLLPREIPKLTPEEVAAIDKKFLKKYVYHLLYGCEWSTEDLLMLSDKGREEKALLDKKYEEVMQASQQKMLAYFELL